MTADLASTWCAGGQRWSWRGHSMFVREEGAGEPLLLIHGFPTWSLDWAPVWPALARRFRVITADLLGFGFSAKPHPHRYTIAEQADVLSDLLAARQLSAARVLAHDYGVTVAQELAARQREGRGVRITELALLNGGIFPETHRPLLTQRLLASPLGPLLARAASYRMFAKALRRIWGRLPLDEDVLREAWHGVAAEHGARVVPSLLGYIAERKRHRARWVGALEQLDAPLQVIVGSQDPISGAHMAARCREVLPRARVVELPDVGHYPQVEAPQQVLSALGWLEAT